MGWRFLSGLSVSSGRREKGNNRVRGGHRTLGWSIVWRLVTPIKYNLPPELTHVLAVKKNPQATDDGVRCNRARARGLLAAAWIIIQLVLRRSLTTLLAAMWPHARLPSKNRRQNSTSFFCARARHQSDFATAVGGFSEMSVRNRQFHRFIESKLCIKHERKYWVTSETF